LSGPFFLALASVGRDARIDVARRIAKLGVENNIGLVFRADIVDFILRDDPGFVKEMTNHMRDPLVFLVTEHPLENDLFDLFEKELNPARGVDPANSRILKFLKEIYSIEDIGEFHFALWDMLSPVYEDLPKYVMSFE